MTVPDPTIALAISCMDLTNLSDECTSDDIRSLTEQARTPHGNVAAVCVWPKFVRNASGQLRGTGIRVATVINFPGGDQTASQVIAETKEAIARGADEIDVVVPWKMLMEGHPENVSARVARVKAAADGAPVKAIVESGMLAKAELIRLATRGAIDGGADFIKTSTGKAPINATPDAARTILEEIRDSGKPIGFKASGGIRSTKAALEYLEIADAIMGDGWARPTTFRIGGSVLLPDLLKNIGQAS